MKSVLNRDALLDILRSRGHVPASEIKKKYHIGTKRLTDLWENDQFITGLSREDWKKPPERRVKGPVGRPKKVQTVTAAG